MISLTADAIVISIEVINVFADDSHRTFDVRRTIASTSGAINIASYWYARRVVGIATCLGLVAPVL